MAALGLRISLIAYPVVALSKVRARAHSAHVQGCRTAVCNAASRGIVRPSLLPVRRANEAVCARVTPRPLLLCGCAQAFLDGLHERLLASPDTFKGML